jgi:hypothetical protein
LDHLGLSPCIQGVLYYGECEIAKRRDDGVEIFCGDSVAPLWPSETQFPATIKTPVNVGLHATTRHFLVHQTSYKPPGFPFPSNSLLPQKCKMNSLRSLVEGASIPELEAIRQFEARCPGSNELSRNLSDILLFEEKNSRDELRSVVEGVCEKFGECPWILEELLGGDEDELPGRSCVLDGSQDKEENSEGEVPRKRKIKKRKRDLLASPPKGKEMKKAKSEAKSRTPRDDKSTLLPSKIPSWWPDNSVVQRESKTSSSSPAAPPKRKRTIAEIFEADRKRREAEAVQEAERRRYEREMQATCAQCKSFFLTDDNWENSCVFHSGE